MRVPIPWVILLAIAVIAGVWAGNTRNMDFLTPPTQARLEHVRINVESSLPRPHQVDPVLPETVTKPPEPPPLPVEKPKPPLDLGDLQAPLTLQYYGERSASGPQHLIELATALEDASEPRRALLAWERVLDLTRPDDSQAATTVSAIKRLRAILPAWNQDTEAATTITLHASAGKNFAKTLPPVLEAVAKELGKSSSGILKVKPMPAIGKTRNPEQNAAPIALWLAGPDKKSAATEAISFTVDSAQDLHHEVLKTVFELVRNHLSSTTAYHPPASLADGEDPLAAMNHRITRLSWSEFAAALNQPKKIPQNPDSP